MPEFHTLPGQHPPTVVCLHSSASSPRQWQALADRLGGAYRVVMPGLIGYTDGPAWSAEQAHSLDHEAAWIERCLDSVGEPVHLVGHSYGAAVSLKVALRHPERIRSLVLYEPVLFRLLTGETLNEVVALAREVTERSRSGDPTRAAQGFVDYWSGPGSWAHLAPGRQTAVAQRIDKVAAEFEALLAERNMLAGYDRLEMPILCLNGSHTREPTRRIARLLQAFLPEANRIELPGLAHMGPITHPEPVNTLIGLFLDTHRAMPARPSVELQQAA